MTDPTTLGQRIRHFRNDRRHDARPARHRGQAGRQPALAHRERQARAEALGAPGGGDGGRRPTRRPARRHPAVRRAWRSRSSSKHAQRGHLFESSAFPPFRIESRDQRMRPWSRSSDSNANCCAAPAGGRGSPSRRVAATPSCAAGCGTAQQLAARTGRDRQEAGRATSVGHESGAITHREVSLGGGAHRVRARARVTISALGALGDRLRERAHLPAASVDPRWPRSAGHGVAGDGPPCSRPRGAW